MDSYFFILTTIDLFVLGFMSLLTKLSESLNKKQKRGFLLAFALIACISVLEVITIVVDGAPTGCRWLNILSNYLGFGLTPAVALCLVYVLDKALKLLHPFMPFVTEEIWQALAPRAEGASICVAPMPEPCQADETLLARFELAKEVISSVRNIRNQKNLPQKEALALHVIADENYPAEYAPVLQKMANLSQIVPVTEKDPTAAAFLVKTTQYFVPMAGRIDAEAERAKLQHDLEYYEGFLASVMKKLSNERFVQSAPEKVVANERAKQADAEAKIAALREQLAALK